MEKALSDMTLAELWELFPIILKDYNPEYKQWYVIEEKDIKNHFTESNIKRISHIGSTAVVGMLAKPTVDILLEIDHNCDLKVLKDALIKRGWSLMSSAKEPQMKMSYSKGYTSQGFAEKVYHLHVRYYDDWDELYFRDYLKEHEAAVQEYIELKLSLRKKYEHDRDSYTEAKTDFVKKFSDIARECYKGRYLPK